MKMVANMVGGQDWLRVLFMAGFTAYLAYRIQKSTTKLLEMQMGSTEMTKASQELLMPSVTFCLESYKHQTTSENITADYKKLPGLQNMLLWLSHIVSIQNKLV